MSAATTTIAAFVFAFVDRAHSHAWRALARVMSSNVRAQSGLSLLELTIVVALVALGALVAVSLWPRHAGEVRLTTQELGAALIASRSLAGGDGATLYADAADATGSTVVHRCVHRPTPESPTFGTGCAIAFTSTQTLGIDTVGPPPWAIFFDPSGSVSVARWTVGTTLAAEPSCTGTIAITVGSAHAADLDCATGSFVPVVTE